MQENNRGTKINKLTTYLQKQLLLLRATTKNKVILKVAVYDALLGILSILLWNQYRVVETQKLSELSKTPLENIAQKTKEELLQISGTTETFINAMFLIVPVFLIIQFTLVAFQKREVYRLITKHRSTKIITFTIPYLILVALLFFNTIFGGNPQYFVTGASLILLVAFHFLHISWYELAATNKWSALKTAAKKATKLHYFILPYTIIVILNTVLNRLAELTLALGKIPAQIISSVLLFLFTAFIVVYLSTIVKNIPIKETNFIKEKTKKRQ